MRFISVLLCVFLLAGCGPDSASGLPTLGGILAQRKQESSQTQPRNTINSNNQSITGLWQQPSTPQIASPSTITPSTINNGFFRSKGSFPEVKVAVLLPLSGQYEPLGRSMLDAAQMALFDMNEAAIELVPFDTQGSALGAVSAASKAIEGGAKVIVGPVFSHSTKAIAHLADEHKVAVLSFSNDKSLAGRGVFALGVRPEQQVEYALRYALSRGIEDYATILPNDVYGGAIGETLRLTVEEQAGASVLKTEYYRMDRNGQPLNLASHVDAVVRAIITKRSQKDFDEETQAYKESPIAFPRAILIPEGGERLRQIIALITSHPMYDAKKIQLIGSAQWESPETSLIAGVEGAWYAAVPNQIKEDFNQKFSRSFGYMPSELSNLAYDATALTITLARMSHGQDFSTGAFVNPNGFSGVGGIFRLRSDGLAERGLAIMKITDSGSEVVEQLPQRFSEMPTVRKAASGNH